MTVHEIIDSLEDQALDKYHLANRDPDSIFVYDADVLMEAARMLKELEASNAPLTLEELREMVREPVWTQWDMSSDDCGFRVIRRAGEFAVEFTDMRCFPVAGYGKTWLAYRQKPKGDRR